MRRKAVRVIRGFQGRPPPGSLGLASRQADLDAASGHLGILLFPDEVDLGRPDIGVASKLPHLVQSTVTMHLK